VSLYVFNELKIFWDLGFIYYRGALLVFLRLDFRIFLILRIGFVGENLIFAGFVLDKVANVVYRKELWLNQNFLRNCNRHDHLVLSFL